MATITELVIAASADPSGVRRGLDQALAFAKQFSREADTALRNTSTAGAGAEEAGAIVAESMLAGMRTTFDSRMATIKEQWARGVLTRSDAARLGGEAAQGYNEALLAGITRLSDKGMLSSDLRQKLVAELRSDGIAAGEAYAQGVEEAAAASSAFAGGAFQGLGRRMQSSGVMVAFAMESMFEGTESGARRAARSISMLAFAVDPLAGALVTAATVGGIAFIDFLQKAEKEAEATRKKVEELYKQIGESGSLEQASKRAQQLYSGDRFVADSDPQAKLIQSGGIEALTKQQTMLQQQLNAIVKPSLDEGGAAMEAYNARVQRVSDALADVNQRLALGTTAWKQVNGLVGDFATKEGAEAQARLAQLQYEHPFAQLVEDVGKLTTAFQQTQHLGLTPSVALVRSLADAQRQVTAELGRQDSATSKQSNTLRGLLVDITSAIGGLSRINMQLPDLYTVGKGSSIALGGEQSAAGDAIARAQSAQYTNDRATAMSRLVGLQAQLTDRIAAEGGPLRANLQLLEAQRQTTESIASLLPRATAKPLPDAFSGIAAQVQAANDALAQARAAKAVGAGNTADLERNANDERQRAIATIRGMIEATDADTSSTKAGREALEELLAILNSMGDTTGKTATGFDAIRNAIHGALDAAGGFGKVGQDVRNVANSVLNAVDAVKQLQKAQQAATSTGTASAGASLAEIGSVIGVVGGVIGAVGALTSIFSTSNATEVEHNALLKQNNASLASLRASMEGIGTASANRGAQSGVQSFLQEPGITTQGTQSHINFSAGYNDIIKGLLSGDLQKFGVTLDQVESMAKQFGIDIYDKNGRLVVSALSQFQEALKLSQQQLQKFGDSFDDQKALSDLHQKVFGKTSGADQYSATLALLDRFAPELAKSLDGIDVSTSDGRKKIEAALQALVLSLEAGTITLEQYGDLEGAKQLAEIIGMLQDSLGTLSTAADAVTSSLLNVPTGFKVAAYRFAATDPVTPQFAPAPTGPGNDTGAGGRSPGLGQFLPASANSGAPWSANGSSPNTIVVQGDVLVDAREQPPEQMFAAVLKVAKRRAAVTYGDSSQWSRVQEA